MDKQAVSLLVCLHTECASFHTCTHTQCTLGVPALSHVPVCYLPGSLDYICACVLRRVGHGASHRKTVLKFLIDICCAVEKLHEAGLLHGDIKPANCYYFYYDSPEHKEMIRAVVSGLCVSCSLLSVRTCVPARHEHANGMTTHARRRVASVQLSVCVCVCMRAHSSETLALQRTHTQRGPGPSLAGHHPTCRRSKPGTCMRMPLRASPVCASTWWHGAKEIASVAVWHRAGCIAQQLLTLCSCALHMQAHCRWRHG